MVAVFCYSFVNTFFFYTCWKSLSSQTVQQLILYYFVVRVKGFYHFCKFSHYHNRRFNVCWHLLIFADQYKLINTNIMMLMRWTKELNVSRWWKLVGCKRFWIKKQKEPFCIHLLVCTLALYKGTNSMSGVQLKHPWLLTDDCFHQIKMSRCWCQQIKYNVYVRDIGIFKYVNQAI